MSKISIVDIYCRVSTEDQAEEGFSLDEQEDKLRSYAAAQGWTVHQTYKDPGYSGAKLERPGLQSVIADCKEHRINKVITYKLDRLSRSQKDTLHLIEDIFIPNKVDYVSMTESFDTGTPFGMAMVGILSVFAQLERENIKERMSMGREHLVKEGYWRGGAGVPFGYRYIPKTADIPGKLIIEPYEAEIVKYAFTHFVQGESMWSLQRSIKETFPELNKEFYNNVRWIKTILENPAYIGKIKHKGKVYEGQHESIVTEAEFYAAQRHMTEYLEQISDSQRYPRSDGHMLSGLLVCGNCGFKWRFKYYSNDTQQGKKRHGCYLCTVKDGILRKSAAGVSCNEKQWKAEDLEAIVWDQVCALQWEDIEPEHKSNEKEIAKIQSRIKAVSQQQSKLMDLYTMGEFPLSMVKEKSEKLSKERRDLLSQLLELQSEPLWQNKEVILSALEAIKDIRSQGSEEEQRRILRILIKKIVVGPGKQLRIEWNI